MNIHGLNNICCFKAGLGGGHIEIMENLSLHESEKAIGILSSKLNFGKIEN